MKISFEQIFFVLLGLSLNFIYNFARVFDGRFLCVCRAVILNVYLEMSENKRKVGKSAKSKAEISPKPPKKSLMKRILMIATAVVALAALAWIGFSLFGNNYKKTALEMKVNTQVAQRLALIMLNDYQSNWLRMETDKLAMNDKGEWVSTDDPKQLIAWRKQFFSQNGAEGALQKLLQEIDGNLDDMKLTPAKYRDTKDNFKEAAQAVKQLAQLTANPGDSLIGMCSRMGELTKKINDALEPTDFNFWVTLDVVKAKADVVAQSIKSKEVVEALQKTTTGEQNNAINVLKYKKLGFKELPGGKGVLYREITPGKGPYPKDDTKLLVHYEGKLMDGTVFDSSYNRGQPASMRPSQTVPGFWHSLVKMKAGSKWEVYIPYDQAYGNRAAGAVKPYSDLFFTLEIIQFEN